MLSKIQISLYLSKNGSKGRVAKLLIHKLYKHDHCTNTNATITSLKDSEKNIDRSEKIQMRRISNELEMVLQNRCNISRVARELAPSWRYTGDPSIETNRRGLEWKNSDCQHMNLENQTEKIEHLCDVLKSNGGCVNRSCGLHVHIDATGIRRSKRMVIRKNYARIQKCLHLFIAGSRIYNPHCWPLMLTDIREEYNKYSAIRTCDNLGTLEFRQYQATLNAYEIIMFNNFVHTFVKSSLRKGIISPPQGNSTFPVTVESFESIFNFFEFNEELKEHFVRQMCDPNYKYVRRVIHPRIFQNNISKESFYRI